MRAIVTGGASGIGAALVARLRAEEIEVTVLDLTTGFDVREPAHWDGVGPTEIACLNAGILGGSADPAEISLERYRQTMQVNVDGVVLGVRRLAQVMPPGGCIIVTASLAGLTPMPNDPVYAATKHAVIGFVRSVAVPLATRGIAINAVCPGIADTPMVTDEVRERLSAADFPLLEPAEVAATAWLAIGSGLTGHAWVVQPGRRPLDFRFPNVPGARGPEGPSGPPPPLVD
jgi:NAD(P)-dependent dehydrogenase (short-subunit alcohol dehydrogenase family)